MKPIDCLISSLQDKIRWHKRSGIGTRIRVYVARQNLTVVTEALGKVAHELLRGGEWDASEMGEKEYQIRREQLIKELFYSQRIWVEVIRKDWPFPGGDFLCLHPAMADEIYFDLTPCDSVPTIEPEVFDEQSVPVT
jgi:hypothetical protein